MLGGAGPSWLHLRSDAVVGVGGGATTDLAGFVAATWLRGVRLVHVPTTVLGMADAAVGQDGHQHPRRGQEPRGLPSTRPPACFCDLDALRSLPAVDVAAGLAEVAKVGFTSDPVVLELVEADAAAAVDVEGDVLRELIERAVRVKAEVVSDDLRESRPGGLGREVLNYGHTFGHAVENVEHYTWRHGHAVSVGLVFVAALARLAGRLDAGDAARHGEILRSLGLPTAYAAGRFPALLDAMRIDKKSRGDQLRFVVLDAIGSPGLLEGPDLSLVEAAYDEVSEVAP
ncbi:MAG: 3-dehydroquinate synthase family protein [Candidatus Nanopelagicales bacterium]